MINITVKRGFKRAVSIPVTVSPTFNGIIYPEIVGALPEDIRVIINSTTVTNTTSNLDFTVYVGGLASAGLYLITLTGSPKPEADILITLEVTE